MTDNNNNTQNPNPAPQQPQPQQKQKKPIYKKVWFWIIIVLVVLFLGSCAALLGSDDTGTGTDKEAKSKSEAKKDDMKDVDEETETKKKFYTVGETAKYNGISMKFEKAVVSHGDKSKFIEPDKGKEFVICVFKVKNKSDDKISMSWATFEAYVDDKSIDEDIIGLQLPEAEKYGSFDGEIAPGKSLEGSVVYQLKKGWKKLEMRTDLGFGLFDENQVIFKVKNKK
ncbi:MAG: DUF5067 domain-containing protein [Eubacterium sp.]|nr:DUF5067 domain-containing protein [Eubacterium sp.]